MNITIRPEFFRSFSVKLQGWVSARNKNAMVAMSMTVSSWTPTGRMLLIGVDEQFFAELRQQGLHNEWDIQQA